MRIEHLLITRGFVGYHSNNNCLMFIKGYGNGKISCRAFIEFYEKTYEIKNYGITISGEIKDKFDFDKLKMLYKDFREVFEIVKNKRTM